MATQTIQTQGEQSPMRREISEPDFKFSWLLLAVAFVMAVVVTATIAVFILAVL